MTIKCFLLEETPKLKRYLRRFRYSNDASCTKTGSYCNAMVEVSGSESLPRQTIQYYSPDEFTGDPRWPVNCEACGVAFDATDPYQVFARRVYRRTDTGEEMTWEAAPPGAMRFAWWLSEELTEGFYVGPDGECLVVKLPPDGHEWIVDSRAKNCTLPEDNKHKCWVRHGVPPNITVDKNGLTCAAGAGSIQTPRWHGFLRNGELVT